MQSFNYISNKLAFSSDNNSWDQVTPPPHSPPREALPSLDDLFCKQAGVAVGVPWSKRTRPSTGPLTGSSLQPHQVLVLLDS
jgi:hypothetical protein